MVSGRLHVSRFPDEVRGEGTVIGPAAVNILLAVEQQRFCQAVNSSSFLGFSGNRGEGRARVPLGSLRPSSRVRNQSNPNDNVTTVE